jgi:hypothetical protein
LELANAKLFHDALAIANNVDPSQLSFSWLVGAVPAEYVMHSCYVSTLSDLPFSPNYVIQATNNANVSDIFAETAAFSIGVVGSSTGSTSTLTANGTSTITGSS